MTSLSHTYSEGLRTRLDSIEAVNEDGLSRATEILAGVVSGGGVIHAFGTGHSQASALEIAGRAGGLIPTNRIAISDLVIYGGESPNVLDDPLLERDERLGLRLIELADVQPRDAMILFSNSGVNGAIVQMAVSMVERGVPVIAVTSRAHAETSVSKHSGGRLLAEVAEVVLDNLAPVGDAIVPLEGGARICGVSSITAAYLVQVLVARVATSMLAAGTLPPFYLSANVEGGHERNLEIEQTYAGRLRRIAT
ncbi:SIS domain-containing protein [Microbacterium sp. W4I20]|uniref:SIS domain-containing protein n=1 Tax=Microbacterium sp. W4I20 TaxID=3042262 RepID=UPI002786A100|nr:SIS domain-containing protein [Microbacterium sp. W4I20]MDQ0726710.1 putative phosphosugar-binding protein [Microbacterium sp. W4I20]